MSSLRLFSIFNYFLRWFSLMLEWFPRRAKKKLHLLPNIRSDFADDYSDKLIHPIPQGNSCRDALLIEISFDRFHCNEGLGARVDDNRDGVAPSSLASAVPSLDLTPTAEPDNDVDTLNPAMSAPPKEGMNMDLRKYPSPSLLVRTWKTPVHLCLCFWNRWTCQILVCYYEVYHVHCNFIKISYLLPLSWLTI